MYPNLKQITSNVPQALPVYFQQRRDSWRPDLTMDKALRRLPLRLMVFWLVAYLLSGLHAGFFTLQEFGFVILPIVVWENITFLGDTMVALAILFLFSFRYPHLVMAIIVAAIVGTILTHGLKGLFGTMRPPGVLEPHEFTLIGPGFRNESLPSGHTVTAFITAVLLTRAVQRPVFKWLLLLMAALVGLSRVIVGVHWPLDVVMGAAIGIFSGWVGLRASDLMQLTVTRYLILSAILALNAILLLFEDGGFESTGIVAKVLAGCVLIYWPLHWITYLLSQEEGGPGQGPDLSSQSGELN